MKRYPQLSLVHPARTLGVWAVVIGLAGIAIAVFPRLEVNPSLDRTDLATVGGGAFAVLLICTSMSLRSWQSVVATALVVIGSLSVTYAAMSIEGIELSVPRSAITVLLMALALQYSAYLDHAYRARVHHERRMHRPVPADHRFLISEALRDVRGSFTLSAITTAIALGAVYVNGTGDLRRTGGLLVVGVVTTSIGAMTIIPAMFALFPVGVPAVHVQHRWVTSITRAAGRLASARPRTMFAISIVLLAIGVFGVTEIEPRTSAMAEWTVKPIGLAIGLIWIVLMIGLGSIKLGTLSLIPIVGPLLLVYAVLAVTGHPLDPSAVVAGAVALGMLADHAIRGVKTWLREYRRPGGDPERAVTTMLTEVGTPLVLSCMIVAVGFSTLLLSRDGALVGLGGMLMLVPAGALLWGLACTPAVLRLTNMRQMKPTPAGAGAFTQFRKVTADEERASFAQYPDDEIMNMNTADFLALAGKTVLRHGGSNGTRRLLVELDIQPGARVLELGAGVGATAFDLVRWHPTIHVTGVDLSAFMIERSRRRAKEQAEADRMRRRRPATAAHATSPYERRRERRTSISGDERRRDDRRQPRVGLGESVSFVHTTDPNVLPFEDNTFDVVIVESVAMYNDATQFFREVLRVLKPGGRLGLHDWCWTEKPSAELEASTCIMACGCDIGTVKFFTQDRWEQSLVRQGFEIGFAEQYPFTFFSWSTMRDDEGTWRLLKMFARVLARKATAIRMWRMIAFLARHEGAFGYTVTIAKKPLVAPAVATTAIGAPRQAASG